MFDAAVDDKAVDDGDDVGDTVAWVKDCSRVADVFVDSWWGDEGEDCLHSDVESLHVEGLEHNLSHVLPVLGRIKRGFGKNNDCLLRIAS